MIVTLPVQPRTRPSATGSRGDVLRFITAGSVDDGKSTLIGRLLFDTRTVLEDQLAAVAHASQKRGMRDTDLSLLTDGLEAEREQGITIDVAYRYFATARRKFIIADTPGHTQYTRNMATGASTAQAAIIVADVTKGLLEQGRRHLYIAHLLGIRDLIVAVNKMDLVDYERAAFERVRGAFEEFAQQLQPVPRLHCVPLSALNGDMVVERGGRLPWHAGPTLLELLETVEGASGAASSLSIALPLRFPVQLVQRIRGHARSYLGRIASGSIAVGDRITVFPAGVETSVQSIRIGLDDAASARAGQSIAVTLADEVDVARGDVFARVDAVPSLSREIDATLIWLAADALKPGGRYVVKHMTRSAKARITQVRHVVDIGELTAVTPQGPLLMNQIAGVTLMVQKPLAVDPYRVNRATGAFILIDEVTHQTVAAGMVE